MKTENLKPYEVKMDCVLAKSESRFREVGKSGLRAWTNSIRYIFKNYTAAREAKENEIYGELMQMETIAKECEPAEASAKLIEKIHRLKGVVGVICLCFLCANSGLPFRHVARRGLNGGQTQIMKMLRRDEVSWIGYC